MSEPSRHDMLIDSLAAELAPVRRLLSPWVRTAGWLLLVAAIAAGLLIQHGASGMLQRWAGAPDLRWAAVGAAITMVCAAWAAFALGVPGRRAGWAWLPVPGLLLWIGASGVGCLRGWVAPGTQVASLHQSNDCLLFIIGFSIPLSALLVWLLRRACPLRPALTAAMIGAASAAASASLLQIVHLFDAAVSDLLVHACAVAAVVGVNALLGGRLLSRH